MSLPRTPSPANRDGAAGSICALYEWTTISPEHPTLPAPVSYGRPPEVPNTRTYHPAFAQIEANEMD